MQVRSPEILGLTTVAWPCMVAMQTTGGTLHHTLDTVLGVLQQGAVHCGYSALWIQCTVDTVHSAPYPAGGSAHRDRKRLVAW